MVTPLIAPNIMNYNIGKFVKQLADNIGKYQFIWKTIT